ncbi:hypothetical protein BPA30113_01010 [Burkholderia paludis]|uniref:Uncharacterized protein n=1 Tax=Burkholderia paludis TaxID=1506587 RepID=A0A6J5D110_9BURK|nr:hypothetical protein LMG30113_00325 [Burkholderia paludis]VWB27397.1 hypothetical protein BPA30113_01010 [Burkholderia paludis]
MVHGINIEVSFRQFYIDGGGSFYHPPVSPNDGNAARGRDGSRFAMHRKKVLTQLIGAL